MKYEICKRYCFVDSLPVKILFVNEMPFAMDPLEDFEKNDKWVMSECALNPTYTLDEMLKWSEYLIEEECHPVLFELELVTKEGLHDESIY